VWAAADTYPGLHVHIHVTVLVQLGPCVCAVIVVAGVAGAFVVDTFGENAVVVCARVVGAVMVFVGMSSSGYSCSYSSSSTAVRKYYENQILFLAMIVELSNQCF